MKFTKSWSSLQSLLHPSITTSL